MTKLIHCDFHHGNIILNQQYGLFISDLGLYLLLINGTVLPFKHSVKMITS